MNTGERIVYIRENNLVKPNIKQGEFAETLDTYQVKIADLESGKQKNIPIPLAKKISKLYKVNFEWLLTGEGNPFTEESQKVDTTEIPEKGFRCKCQEN